MRSQIVTACFEDANCDLNFFQYLLNYISNITNRDVKIHVIPIWDKLWLIVSYTILLTSTKWLFKIAGMMK